MKRFLLAYLVSIILLGVVLLVHYMEMLKAILGDVYSEVAWKAEVMVMAFWQPLLILSLMIGLLFFAGYLIFWLIVKKIGITNSNYLLGGFVVIALLAGGLFLGFFEPVLSTDYFEYGVRQELNRLFEMIGYGRINVTVYFYLTLTAILIWFFVRKETNRSTTKKALPNSNSELLDD